MKRWLSPSCRWTINSAFDIPCLFANRHRWHVSRCTPHPSPPQQLSAHVKPLFAEAGCQLFHLIVIVMEWHHSSSCHQAIPSASDTISYRHRIAYYLTSITAACTWQFMPIFAPTPSCHYCNSAIIARIFTRRHALATINLPRYPRYEVLLSKEMPGRTS